MVNRIKDFRSLVDDYSDDCNKSKTSVTINDVFVYPVIGAKGDCASIMLFPGWEVVLCPDGQWYLSDTTGG